LTETNTITATLDHLHSGSYKATSIPSTALGFTAARGVVQQSARLITSRGFELDLRPDGATAGGLEGRIQRAGSPGLPRGGRTMRGPVFASYRGGRLFGIAPDVQPRRAYPMRGLGTGVGSGITEYQSASGRALRGAGCCRERRRWVSPEERFRQRSFSPGHAQMGSRIFARWAPQSLAGGPACHGTDPGVARDRLFTVYFRLYIAPLRR